MVLNDPVIGINTGQTFDEHIEHMRKDKSWADEVHVYVAAHVLKRPIHLCEYVTDVGIAQDKWNGFTPPAAPASTFPTSPPSG